MDKGEVWLVEENQLFTTRQLSEWTGVSVRKIRWFDKTQLLKPYERNSSNYRLYRKQELITLLIIIFLQFFGFSFKEIRTILKSPSFDAAEVLAVQARVIDRGIDQLIDVSGILNCISSSINKSQPVDIAEIAKPFAIITEYDPKSWFKLFV